MLEINKFWQFCKTPGTKKFTEKEEKEKEDNGGMKTVRMQPMEF